jgi:predicted nucleic acid-binding protein
MILVADASALIALATCDGLPWLDALFGEVLVPEAVFREVTFADKPQAMRLNTYLQGKIRQVDMADFVYLDAYADAGETQAMVLYKSAGADYLLIDDKKGRKVAQINRIKTIGSVGVLIQAKKAGLIKHVKPSIDLIIASQIYMSTELINAVLAMADEH